MRNDNVEWVKLNVALKTGLMALKSKERELSGHLTHYAEE